MKNLRKVSAAVIFAVATLSLASCLDSDDDTDYGITPEQYDQYLSLMAGMYSGNIYFWNDTITTGKKDQNGELIKTDSCKTSVMVYGKGDSIMNVTIPTKYLAKAIKDNDKLKEALNETPAQKISIKFYLYQTQGSNLYFGTYPGKLSVPVSYDGESHNVVFSFYNSYNYNGVFYDKRILTNVYLTKIELDNKEITRFSVSPTYAENNAVYQVLVRSSF